MGLRERCGRGFWRSGVVIVVTVSSKEFLGTVGTRFAYGKPEKNSWRASLGGYSKLRFRVSFSVTYTSPDGRTFVWKGLRVLARRFCRPCTAALLVEIDPVALISHHWPSRTNCTSSAYRRDRAAIACLLDPEGPVSLRFPESALEELFPRLYPQV
jgi:hypothetical protein